MGTSAVLPRGLFMLLWSLISFKQSFRIGIDTDHPDKLIVDGVFALATIPSMSRLRWS